MGILTDPSLTRRNQLGRNLTKHKQKICFLLYIISLAWFCCLALNDYNHATYLSENALSPGLVYSEIRYNSAKYAQTLLEELEMQRQFYKNEIPYSWIQAKMKQIGLEVYIHNFTLNYPFGGGKIFKGKNIYGILRAPRIGSTEGIVFSTPYRPPNSVHTENTASLAALLAFAEFAITKSYWAKDLIFLVTDQEQLGIHAWLKAYHYGSQGDNSVLNAGNLKGRSGSLQAAVNLEIESLDASSIDVKIEGLNGQLPNLDMFNLVQRLALTENAFSSNRYSQKKRKGNGSFKTNIMNMLSMITTQANGVPTGNHGLFLPYRIEALTLTGSKRENSNYNKKQANAQIILKMIESICRSLNNLLERFHQSFFFYILVTDDRFVSIGDYMPCMGLMVGALLIKGFLLWLSINESEDNDNTKSIKTDKIDLTDAKLDFSYTEVGYAFIIAQSIGFIAYYLPQNKFLSEFLYKNNVTTELGIGLIFGFIVLIGILSPLFIKILNHKSTELLHILALLYLASVLIVIGLLNFSLGFILGTISTPFAIFLNIEHGNLLKNLSIIYLILLNPLCVIFTVVTKLTLNAFPELILSEILMKSIKATIDAITFSLVDFIVYENWLFKAATLTFLTSWTLFWCLLWKSKKQVVKKLKIQ